MGTGHGVGQPPAAAFFEGMNVPMLTMEMDAPWLGQVVLNPAITIDQTYPDNLNTQAELSLGGTKARLHARELRIAKDFNSLPSAISQVASTANTQFYNL